MFQKKSIAAFTKIVLSLISAGLIISCACSDKSMEMPSRWSVGSVTIDGKSDDWHDIPLTYFQDSQVSLGLRNETENLYILFCFKNQLWARLIQAGGVTLWLDNTGNKQSSLGIRYAAGSTSSQMPPEDERGFRDRFPPELQERMLERQSQMSRQVTIIDKHTNREISIPADGSQGPAASFACENGFYSYEFKIPLEMSGNNRFGFDSQGGKTIGLGLEWGDMAVPGQMKRERGAGMGGGGMPPDGPPEGMGRPPEGMGSGFGGRGGGPSTQPPPKQTLWVKISLSSPPAKQ
jgi:hypothetical protein